MSLARHQLRALLVLIGVLTAFAGSARGIDTSDGLIHGCYYTTDTPAFRAGTLRIVDPGTACPAGQQAALTWRIAGGRGPLGERGPTGRSVGGAQGPPGPAGPRGLRGEKGRSAGALQVTHGPLGSVHVIAKTFTSDTFNVASENNRSYASFEAPCSPGEEPVAAGVTIGGNPNHFVPEILSSYPDPARHAWEVNTAIVFAPKGEPWSVTITVTCWPGYPSRPPIAHRLQRAQRLFKVP